MTTRKIFLTTTGLVALAVGTAALAVPGALLASKGVTDTEATRVWVREVGVLLAAAGATALAVRGHPASPTLRVLLLGNLAIQLGLLPVEPLAWLSGVVTRPAGILPNTVVHLALAAGFAWHARQVTAQASALGTHEPSSRRTPGPRSAPGPL